MKIGQFRYIDYEDRAARRNHMPLAGDVIEMTRMTGFQIKRPLYARFVEGTEYVVLCGWYAIPNTGDPISRGRTFYLDGSCPTDIQWRTLEADDLDKAWAHIAAEQLLGETT